MKITYLAVAFLMLMPATASPQSLPGDAARGKALAIGICAECHAVAQDQRRSALDGVPAFLTLARDPAITELRLRSVLQTPHARMPSVILTRREMDDVISYILSMRLTN